MFGMYIHIPYCTRKCYYCDFNSYALKGSLKEYLEALKKEIYLYGQFGFRELSSIYFGGGTPSLCSPEEIREVLEKVRELFLVPADVEITLEANPEGLSLERLSGYRDVGINRLSIGLQATDEEILRSLGRPHSLEDFSLAYQWANQAGFENINVDLIFALPNQSFIQWQESLKYVAELAPTHISLYNLEIHPDTLFYKWFNQGKLRVKEDEEELEQYLWAIEYLQGKGYQHYEVSNFALLGRQAKHNLVYWHNQYYFGLGAGASGFIPGERTLNVRNPEEYITLLQQDILPYAERFEVTKEIEMSETMFMGLRLLEGVSLEVFQKRFGITPYSIWGQEIEELVAKGYLETSNTHLRLSNRGLPLANQVFMAFV